MPAPDTETTRMNIQGQVVHLRTIDAEDLARIRGWINREDISSFMGIRTPVSAMEQKSWYEALQRSQDKKVFAIVRTVDSLHIGNVSIDHISARDRNARLTIFIGEEDFRGKGYGRDAVMATLEYGFQSLGLNKVYLIVHEENDRAIRLYERCGFKREGFLREQECIGGEYVNKYFMGILRREFQKQ